MSTPVPPLFTGLVDDASVLPPGTTGVPEALTSFRAHADAWYAAMVGSLLVPSSLVAVDRPWSGLTVSVVNDGAIGALPAVVGRLQAGGARVRQVEAAVARRGEDPQPGLAELAELARAGPGLEVYAEIPLSWGLLLALDTVQSARRDGLRIAP